MYWICIILFDAVQRALPTPPFFDVVPAKTTVVIVVMESKTTIINVKVRIFFILNLPLPVFSRSKPILQVVAGYQFCIQHSLVQTPVRSHPPDKPLL